MFGFLKKQEKPLNRKDFKGWIPSVFRTDNEKYNKYKEFRELGGALSGVYDVSDNKTRIFVEKYSEFIKPQHIYKRNKNGILIPYFSQERRAEKKWQSDYNKRQKYNRKKTPRK